MSPVMGLINNAALLVALGVLLDLVLRMRLSSKLWTRIFTGVALGAIGVAIIMNRWSFGGGIIFDTRSIILSLGGLFFGAVPTVIAIAIIGVFRVYVGGAGMWMGLGVILTSGVIGILWRYQRRNRLAEIGWIELLIFGLVVHIAMILWTISLPGQHVQKVILSISFPVLVIYPLATVLLGSLLSGQLAHRQVQKTLEESEQKYRMLADGAMEGILVAQDGILRFVNPRALEIVGYSESELLGAPFTNFIHPDDRETVLSRHYRRLKGDILPSRYPIRILTRDGVEKFVEIDSGMITWEKKPATVVFLTDISERKLVEEALRLSEVQKSAILNGITTNIAFVNDKLEIQWANKIAAESVGKSPEEMIGATCHSLWANPEGACENCPTMKAFKTKKSEETIMITPDGRIWNERGEPVFDDKGNLMGVVEVAQDITEYMRLSEQEKLLVKAVEQAAEGVLITDATGIIQYANPSEQTISGYSRHELLGQTPDIFKGDKHDENFYRNMWETINAGNVWTGRFINKRKDGTEYHEDATISPVYDKSGNLTNFVSVKHDVTKHIELQEQLFQAQKMEAIGTLAGGFAHDFNNKLQVIAGYVDLISFNKDLPASVKMDLGVIKQTVDSSAQLIKGMMVFSRKTSVRLEPLNLNKLVAQLHTMIAPVMPRMIDIDLVMPDDLWTINASPSQIDQILMNLAVNARDSMPDGGKLTIQTQNTILDEEFCRPYPNTKPGRYVLLSMTDTGKGMDHETVKHIFEPFFTTKAEGKGTGLGLSVVYGIVEKHGGKIICNSQPSEGATFKIYFPATEEVPEEQYSEKKEPPKGHGETVLIVDDEPNITELASRILAETNYVVIAASNGKDALGLYEKHHEAIRLVILDLIMPGIDGKHCLQELRNMDPNVRVLIASGENRQGMAEELKDSGAKDFIGKPFDIPQLLYKIREIIDKD